MAGQKRKRRSVQLPETPTSSPETQTEEEQPVSPNHQRFTVWDYLFVNLFFWVFCWLQRTVAEYLNGDDMGLDFFFYTMAAGFSLVSLVAFIHDLLSGEVVSESEL
jgi:hypothetical protein